MEDLEVLRQIPYFADLEETDLRLLAEVGHQEHYPSGATILEEGEIQNSLYFIIAGQVKICLDKILCRKLTVNTLTKGELFGETCLMGEGRPSPKVVAQENTAVIRFAKEDFLRAIDNDPAILANIMQERPFKHKAHYEDEINEESQFQKELSIFEKRFSMELEGIKLISKKIEEISDETIARVEKRTAEAFELSEKRSKEVTDHAEREAEHAIKTAQESIAKALEEGKVHTEAAITQVNEVLQTVKSETKAFWDNIHIWRKRISYILALLITVLGFLGYHFGYKEFNNVMEIKHKLLLDQKVIEEARKDVEKVRQEVNNEKERFITKFSELSALDALVLRIGRTSNEAGLKDDAIERYKQINMNYRDSKRELLNFIDDYEYKDVQPEVVVEAVNNYLKLVDLAGDKTIGKENPTILESCLESLRHINEKWEKKRNFRYRLKVRDNFILFGKILQRNNRDFYNMYFMPTMIDFFSKLDGLEKVTLAEALVTLGIEDNGAITLLTSVMQTPGEKLFWRRYSAAIALMHIRYPKAHDYLLAEMQGHKKNRLIVAMLLGEAMVKDSAVKLSQADFEEIKVRLKEGINDNSNKFQRDYAQAVLTRLNQVQPRQE